ncbi:unnamed protein product [Rotaria sp. Silwood2]|nr:unnamed protein product [Rotaria sp. Silwood2]
MLKGAQFVNLMENLNQDIDTNVENSTVINDTSSMNAASTNNTQNQSHLSFPKVAASSMLDDAIREIESSCQIKGTRIEAIDISVALIILKARHRLSNKCLSDILKLLRILRVPNVPNSWWKCKKLLHEKKNGYINAKKRSICPSCKEMSEDINRCRQCNLIYDEMVPVTSIPIFYHFDISLQLESILLNTRDLIFPDLSVLPADTMHDIVDGMYYHDRLNAETDRFITLTMNIDGVQPNKGSDASLWPNLILAGIWPGPKKPSRDDMSIFLRGVVVETEKGGHVNSFKINANKTPAKRSNERSTKSTRRHSLEIMNNLQYLRDAWFHLDDSQMDYSLHSFLSSLINNHETNQRLPVFIQPRHPVNISDPQISALFSSKITYYSTAFIGEIRFTTSNYCHKKSTDDSSIVYRAGDEVHFGRIHRIFTVDDGEVLFQIFSLSSSSDFTCEVNDEQFYYDEIEIGTITSGTTICIIKAEQIIEKCVFYLQSNGRATFIRFPNLEEHS